MHTKIQEHKPRDVHLLVTRLFRGCISEFPFLAIHLNVLGLLTEMACPGRNNAVKWTPISSPMLRLQAKDPSS